MVGGPEPVMSPVRHVTWFELGACIREKGPCPARRFQYRRETGHLATGRKDGHALAGYKHAIGPSREAPLPLPSIGIRCRIDADADLSASVPFLQGGRNECKSKRMQIGSHNWRRRTSRRCAPPSRRSWYRSANRHTQALGCRALSVSIIMHLAERNAQALACPHPKDERQSATSAGSNEAPFIVPG